MITFVKAKFRYKLKSEFRIEFRVYFRYDHSPRFLPLYSINHLIKRVGDFELVDGFKRGDDFEPVDGFKRSNGFEQIA